ncbi:hypothetical protein EC973_004731 [Apophysomyces ossiformis]|uniref:Uncharacterized protein n=1 Tax=Apophysomyces ossiformis TaxID=679940 RepID=A0A8H7BKX6_9FUNG|nr:hypothetical protein EC973_004731 [Apophysomyces ossiformis]
MADWMLQDHPPKVQPRSSAARDKNLLETSLKNSVDISQRFPDYASLDKMDAEAGCILIALANQTTPTTKSTEPNRDMSMDVDSCDTRGGNGDSSTTTTTTTTNGHSMSISNLLGGLSSSSLHSNDYSSNETNCHRPDPIMLLAAAAAAIDGDDIKYNGRSYERREIVLERRSDEPVYGYREARLQKRKSLVENERSSSRPRYHPTLSEGRRHRQEHEFDTWQQEPLIEDRRQSNSSTQHGVRSETTNTFSWQYLSMKQNPKIKRNAMHAYITYMIYTDMAHERSRTNKSIPSTRRPRDNELADKRNHDSRAFVRPGDKGQEPQVGYAAAYSRAHDGSDQGRSEIKTSGLSKPPISTSSFSTSHAGLPMHYPADTVRAESSSSSTWYPAYRLPPSPTQRHDFPSAQAHLHRPLTAFLWDGNGSGEAERRYENVVLPPLSVSPQLINRP